MIKHRAALKELAKKMNDKGIVWGLGASYMLYLNGIDISVNDIDIIVQLSDKDLLDEVLKDYEYNLTDRNEKYGTKYFYSLEVQGIEFDIMIDFTIYHDEGTYEFPFSSCLVDKVIHFDETPIYLTSLQEWLNAYTLMGRDKQIKLIKEHLNK